MKYWLFAAAAAAFLSPQTASAQHWRDLATTSAGSVGPAGRGQHASAFVGATFTIAKDKGHARPELGLELRPAMRVEGQSLRFGSGVGIRIGDEVRLSLAGQDVEPATEPKKKKSRTLLYVVGGVAAVGVLLVVAASSVPPIVDFDDGPFV